MSQLIFGASWYALTDTISVHAAPITKVIIRRALAAMNAAQEESKATGNSDAMAIDDGFDAYIRSIVTDTVTGWKGVVESVKDGEGEKVVPVEATPANIATFFSQDAARHRFQEVYIEPYFDLVAEKNASSPSVSTSTSETAANTAPTADSSKGKAAMIAP